MADADIIKQGFLVKKGHFRHNWRTRWFELSREDMCYYRNRHDRTPAGVINLAGATITCPTLDESKKPWMIQIKTADKRELWMQAPDQPTREEWTTAIEETVRKLDRHNFSPERAATVKLTGNEHTSKRDIVQAMQDRSGGVQLAEFKCKGLRQPTKYFNGKTAIDWLISWSFCSTRSEAIKIASYLLRHRFFQPVRFDYDKGNCINLKDDPIYAREIMDTEDSYYVFVCFSPTEQLDLFEPSSDSESDDDLLSAKYITHTGYDLGDGKVIKQGFLRKKGHVRHNWKARLFVLKEKQEYFCYYRGSKQMSKPLGSIPLRDLSILALDNEGDPDVLTTSGSPSNSPGTNRRSSRLKVKVNRILLITATGLRYTLEAASSEDRDSWISQLKVASKLI